MWFFNRAKRCGDSSDSQKAECSMTQYCFDDFAINAMAGNLFELPEVCRAIDYVANMVSICPFYHVRNKNNSIAYIESEVSHVLDLQPNNESNARYFWYKVVSDLLKYNFVAILPYFNEKGTLFALTQFADTEYVTDFVNGKKVVILGGKNYLLKNVIILRNYNCKANLSLHKELMRTIQERAKSNVEFSKQIQGIVKQYSSNATMSSGEVLKSRANTAISKNDIGDMTGLNVAILNGQLEFQQLNIPLPHIDNVLLGNVVSTVYNYFRVSQSLLDYKATEIEFELFVLSSIMPLVERIQNELTIKIFSAFERGHGNKIEIDISKLKTSTTNSKTAYFKTMYENGLLNADEIREMEGYGKRADGLGDKYMSNLNLVPSDIAEQYQINRSLQKEKE